MARLHRSFSKGPSAGKTRSRMQVSGLQDYVSSLEGTMDEIVPALKSALTAEQIGIMGRSQELVPVDVGTLKGSGRVMPAVVSGTHVEVVSGYGGAAADYALMQHENLEFSHKEGQQAKYLEQPAREALAGMESRIADRIGEVGQ